MNHSRAVPLISTQCSRRKIKILWSTVSNAAVRSSRIRMAQSPVSVVNSRSLKTFSSADSVLWRALKPDWKGSRRLCVLKGDVMIWCMKWYKIWCRATGLSHVTETGRGRESETAGGTREKEEGERTVNMANMAMNYKNIEKKEKPIDLWMKR